MPPALAVTLDPEDAKLAEAVTLAEARLLTTALGAAAAWRDGQTNDSGRLRTNMENLVAAADKLRHALHALHTFGGQSR